MRPGLTSVGLAFAMALAGGDAARADPAFEIFRDICVKTRAKMGPALAAADAQGWTDMPAMYLQEIARQGFGAGEGRARSKNRILMLMYAGKGSPVIDGEPLPVRACALAARPANGAAMRKAAAAFAAVPAERRLPTAKGEAYAFIDTGDGHEALSAGDLRSSHGRSLIRQGRVSLLIVSGRPETPLLVYAIPTL